MIKTRNLLLLLLIFCLSCSSNNQLDLPTDRTQPEPAETTTYGGPEAITRSIIQAENGDIWLAAFDGVFRYDGKSFSRVTAGVSSARFFSLLQDRQGNFWFGSIGSGAYYYNGKDFQRFTSNDGLVSNEIVCIYEDKAGNIWFGAHGGVSRYDGKSFRNYVMKGDTMVEGSADELVPNLISPNQRSSSINEVNSIIEDKTGRFWLGTRGHTFIFDGKSFTTLTHDGKPFTNVRWIIEDQKGNIWLGGSDGLWLYNGKTFTNLTQSFVGYIYEDSRGNIWTGSRSAAGPFWVLSRYDKNSLTDQKPTATEITSATEDQQGMIFGILEARDESIWFGALDGVYRYNGNKIVHLRNKTERD